MNRSRVKRSRGFTLVEVMLSLALLAGLMTGMSQLIFSLAEVWTKNQAQFVFARHVRAVTHHLDDLLRTSVGTAHASGVTESGPSVREVSLPGGGTADLLTFDLPGGDRVLGWSAEPLPEASCALVWIKDEGLVLYWRSRLEADFEEAASRKVVLSPLVTAFSYEYFDTETKQWSEHEMLRKDGQGRWPVPRRLRLQFSRDGRAVEEYIIVPRPGQGVPAY